MKKYPNRQIHMDFHTSPDIKNIGGEFDKSEFGRILKESGIKLVNLFGKCHHGYYYYPSKIGEQHPNLSFNLLQAQVDACKENDIEYTVYTCVGWNEYISKKHPEWLEVSPEGILGSKAPFERGYYKWNKLCLNNDAYRDLLKLEFKEMAELFNPKALWVDIILQNECVCSSCLKKMKEQNLDPRKKEDRERIMRLAQISFEKEMYEYIKSFDRDLQVYFNGPSKIDLMDDVEISNVVKQQYNSFLDIESLPSAEWGYTHFPISVNFVNKYEKEITMMNGKFHTSWGDFGTLRNELAMEYECFRALVYGAGVCVGDQLHPSGKIDNTVYNRIGRIFKSIEAKEPWCLDTQKMPEIGVYLTTKSSENLLNTVDRAAEGAYRMLQELKYQFDFLCFEDEISHYAAIILPDNVLLTESVAKKINKYIQDGGAVLFSGHSGIDENNKFLIEGLSLTCFGDADFCPRYMNIEETDWNIPTMDYVLNKKGRKIGCMNVDNEIPLEILSYTVNPYFNRSEDHFCSHRQTPPMREVYDEPSIVKQGNVVYLSNPIFSDFAEYGVKVYKDIIANLLNKLIDKPIVKTIMPALCEVIVRKINHGKSQDGLIVHVLNYIIQRKCQELDTIEDSIPIYNCKISIKTSITPSLVRIVPDQYQIEFQFDGTYVDFVVPEINGHTMIEII